MKDLRDLNLNYKKIIDVDDSQFDNQTDVEKRQLSGRLRDMYESCRLTETSTQLASSLNLNYNL